MRNYWGLGVGHVYSHGERPPVNLHQQPPKWEEVESEKEITGTLGESHVPTQTIEEIEENAENQMLDEERETWEIPGDGEEGEEGILSEEEGESDDEFLELHSTYPSR